MMVDKLDSELNEQTKKDIATARRELEEGKGLSTKELKKQFKCL